MPRRRTAAAAASSSLCPGPGGDADEVISALDNHRLLCPLIFARVGRHPGSPTSVRRLLARGRMRPAPRRSGPSWREFLQQQAASIAACDFFTVESISLAATTPSSSSSRAPPRSACRLHDQPFWELGHAAGPQPRPLPGRAADPVPDPRPRQQVQRPLRRGLPQRADPDSADTGPSARSTLRVCFDVRYPHVPQVRTSRGAIPLR